MLISKKASLVFGILSLSGLLSGFFMPQQTPTYCQLHGTFYEVDNPRYAHMIVYEMDSEALADMLIYEADNKFFADRPGLWYFTDTEAFADYNVYFTDVKDQAEFTVYFTTSETFAGCN